MIIPPIPTRSLSARRAWIEIRRALGFVDPDKVALRKESVDRNLLGYVVLWCLFVALRKESVDRNQRIAKPFREQFKSLSARRAWIEISVTRYRPTPKPVALRKESVDRNRNSPICVLNR